MVLTHSMEEIKTEVVSEKFKEENNSDAFSDLQGTILWPRRSNIYRIAFLTMLPMFVLFLLGFSCPFWMKKHQVDKYRGYYNKVDKVDVSIGLWRVCEGLNFADITDCTPLPNTSSYEMACQAMLCLCLIFTFFSLTFGFYENFATRYDLDDGEDPRTRRPEVNAIVSGIFGMIGVCLYGALIIRVAKDGEGGVHWAFPVTASTITGVTICGILMAISNPIHNNPAPGYPGQVVGLSRQNSAHGREVSMQDRLVSSNGLASPLSNDGAATYGVSGEDPNATEMALLQRSDSFMCSHMSSPDLYTSTADRHGDNSQRTHVVETYDLHTRPNDPMRRQALRKQLESKAAQRRSWHFDDKSGAYIVSDLINSRPEGTSTSVKRNETETIKPPVPPRRDKLSPSTSGLASAATPPLQTITDETEDLMVLEDPVVTAPNTASKKSKEKPKVPERKPSMKRNTNPFLEELTFEASSQVPQPANEMNQGAAGSDGWESQPWPDPPTEREILGENLPFRRDKDALADKTSRDNNLQTCANQANAVPESLQYQPQNSGSLSRSSHLNKGSEKQGPKPDLTVTDRKQSSQEEDRNRAQTMKNQRKDNINESHVPVMKEYDNPLFKRHALNNRQDADNGAQLYDSTSFIHPSPSPPQQHYALNPIDSFRRHSSHFPQRSNQDDSLRQCQRQMYNGSPEQVAGQIQGSGKAKAPQPKRNSLKEKPKISEKPNLKNLTRPRQIKREHNQRRTGQDPSGIPTTIPSPGFSSSNPDLSRQSPKTNRQRYDSLGRGDAHIYDSPKVGYHHRPKGQPPAYSDVARQPPPYSSHSAFQHWDSDL